MDKITMINHSDYFRSYDIQYINDLTEEIRQSARVTIIRVNKLITALQQNEIALQINPRYDSVVNSGWRPPAINAAIPTAALASKHMLGQACDLHDPGGDIDEWCMTHQNELSEIGLWLEHPSATKNWCHVQTVAPRSGRRVFYP